MSLHADPAPAETRGEVAIFTQDEAAIVIGGLYREARSSIVDSVRFLIEAGRRLTEKRRACRTARGCRGSPQTNPSWGLSRVLRSG
jgi:hypothetical protein